MMVNLDEDIICKNYLLDCSIGRDRRITIERTYNTYQVVAHTKDGPKKIDHLGSHDDGTDELKKAFKEVEKYFFMREKN